MSARDPPISLALKITSDATLSALNNGSTLTPPLTPVTPVDPSSTTCKEQYNSRPVTPGSHAFGANNTGNSKPEDDRAVLEPLGFNYDLNIQKGPEGDFLEYGRGAWSVVYCATSRSITQSAAPPSPPLGTPPKKSILLAVKSPLRRDAHSILKTEALLLTRLSRAPRKDYHLVPFLGYISPSHSIVMSAVPLSLSAYITDKAAAARETFSTKTMFDPVLSMKGWLALAHSLTKGLDWLHNCGQIVHGDIKPQNILLKPKSNIDTSADQIFPYETLYADFTSSYDLSPAPSNSGAQPSALSALTPPFAAPELLILKSINSSTPSKASDVFSLAITLLTAATGDLLLYSGYSSMQRLAISRDGHRAVEYVRSGTHGSRIPAKGTVERVVSPALVKDPESRIDLHQWLLLIESEAAI
ncbi:serine/threonine protein kinase [Polytolypa hystricis UAMH7299]|uniref:Serine/threonine protein kinase n=1 Tax=Polytolypa hystricis (strain UAMH7299) TaxID=1447883 RepID=A0A2B7YQ81_POLH7|nr:serine/threonine protein kinase [Polytolypa hystricis UAMH7299]